MNDSRLEILMVEDNPADIRLTQLAFETRRIHDALHVVRDGIEAMEFLRRQGRYADANRPDLIFLDLNLPRKDGREVLSEIKTDPELKCIPIVILTTSQSNTDILKCYNLHANCYVVKPVDLDTFIEVVCDIDKFWLATATLPPA